ncbi:hypothetical protein AM2_2215 [Lactococcus cremoris]|uniref:Uncharacterized protein n=2 Tax=Lactococcus lactis subsp. cremoris TaxID=1359 RepID=A2RJZ4_LACLM|nr:hypothetical protein [Lactococcus cremoris]AEU40232.1 hypothetical protein llh_5280 [Lactococcus cremoris subsp. cremoris A76]CAL97601.1 hypothetical protein predicted by Glimmer/Critica [Lactococcus cremoris subsp. cremoris MG1363]KZK05237.1 hypothetical protein AB996_1998 [Lactococcus cremoris]KZK07713.1 hypothetical protein AB995_2212 [Lactococcus cremoris]KZK10729.1 hypothetical protein V4_0289 [Lactococcus cremoris]
MKKTTDKSVSSFSFLSVKNKCNHYHTIFPKIILFIHKYLCKIEENMLE